MNDYYAKGLEAYNIKDYKAAFGYWSCGSNMKDACCDYGLAMLYEHGLFVDKSFRKSQEYYFKSYRRGNSIAIKNIKITGFIIIIFRTLFYSLVKVIASACILLAAGFVAYICYDWAFSYPANKKEKVLPAREQETEDKKGKLLLTHEQEMVEWATANGANAQMQLGLAYFKGEMGIPQNLEKGCVWLYYAAINGNNDARELLKSFIISKKIDELERNAISNGNAEDLVALSALYYIGSKNIQRDERKAEYFLSEAAKYDENAAKILLLFKGIKLLLIFSDQEARSKVEELKQQIIACLQNELSKFDLTDKEIKNELINMGCDFNIIYSNVNHR